MARDIIKQYTDDGYNLTLNKDDETGDSSVSIYMDNIKTQINCHNEIEAQVIYDNLVYNSKGIEIINFN